MDGFSGGPWRLPFPASTIVGCASIWALAAIGACSGDGDNTRDAGAAVDAGVDARHDADAKTDASNPVPVCATVKALAGGFVDFASYHGESDPQICRVITCKYESVGWNTRLLLGSDGTFHLAYRMAGTYTTSMDYRLFLSGNWTVTGCNSIVLSNLYDYCDDCKCESTKSTGSGGKNFYMVDEGYSELEGKVTVMLDGSMRLDLPWPLELENFVLARDSTINKSSVFAIIPGKTVVPRDPALGRPCGYLTGYPTGPCRVDSDSGEKYCLSGMYTETWCITWPKNDLHVCAPQCDADARKHDEQYCRDYFGPDACCGKTGDGKYLCFLPPVKCD